MATETKEPISKPPKHKARNCSLICVGVGVVFICCGGLLLLMWPAVFRHVLAQVLQLGPDSETYKSWVDPEVPSYLDFYFFNWTNPEDVFDPDTKLHFNEMGPYRFREKTHKTDIVFNDNNTVTYKQSHYWFFDEKNSKGSLSDNVTTINAISVSAAYIMRDWNIVYLIGLNQLLKDRPMSVTHNVSQMLFEGYQDKLLDMRNIVGGTNKKNSFDKYGLFYKRNGSTDHDGVYNIGTGVDDLGDVGVVKTWNYAKRTPFFPGSCGDIRGTTGERFLIDEHKEEPVVIFSNSLCRTIDMKYERREVVEGIPGYRYTVREDLFDNGTLDERNSCFCGGECSPSGVLNSSACHENAPVFASMPHFYMADPVLLDKIAGMRPEPHKHDFYITVEPKTGIPLDVAGRLQINMLMQPYSQISHTAHLPRVFFPMFWLDQRATITPDLAASLRLLLMIPRLGQIAAIVLLVLGSGMLTTVILWHYRERRIRRRTKTSNSFDLTPTHGS